MKPGECRVARKIGRHLVAAEAADVDPADPLRAGLAAVEGDLAGAERTGAVVVGRRSVV